MFYSFILHDLYAEDQYLLSLTLSLCWESHGSCQDHHIFRNARLPKPTCNWNMDFKIPGKSKIKLNYYSLEFYQLPCDC